MTKRDKGRLAPFVPLLITTLDSPAWKAMSHGAKSLYVALKRRVPRERNRAYISYRDVEKEIQANSSPTERLVQGASALRLHRHGDARLSRCRRKGQVATLASNRARRDPQGDRKRTPRTSVSRLPKLEWYQVQKNKTPLPPWETHRYPRGKR